MDDESDEIEWTVGERVYVERITDDPSIVIKIFRFIDNMGPDDRTAVSVLVSEWGGTVVKPKLIRQQFHLCWIEELLKSPPGGHKAVKGGAFERVRRNLEPVACGCGCGSLTSGAQFKQGHDAKLKSRLLKIVDGVVDGDPDEAKTELVERGWWKRG